ncbi:hypothetical protein [Helicobacter cinaedi]|uniref:hypothetical protein n=1 Tax=Helicobacter cinaedi TaxID=213 RepID=UPI0015F05A6F|nr:hypothetical protein [Helicobacter cinaedi]
MLKKQAIVPLQLIHKKLKQRETHRFINKQGIQNLANVSIKANLNTSNKKDKRC